MALINIILASKRRHRRGRSGSSFSATRSIWSSPSSSSSSSSQHSNYFDEWPADCQIMILVAVASYSYLLYLSIFG
ncbi:Uncharacterized protein TCM_020619 [Theobroma cacao]|uniref:Uncharacterized protein n=1 Tax=Theobroma cacao TaxID=3641 RepID=A0A061EM38_THECC|nr:Uncharacterized protein TCM_020619 [Theobroma cacao]